MAGTSPQVGPAIVGNTLSLSGSDWRILADPDGTGTARRIFSAATSTGDWLAATVPGNIQADVEAAHRLPPLWYGPINPQLYDVARKDWWYRKDFNVPASLAGERLTLVFDGVDERCQVWLNGRKLGGNAGMFRRFQFDVSAAARPGQVNRLAVQIARMPEELVPYLANSDGPDIPGQPYWFLNGLNRTRQLLKDLKTPGNFSYDWSTNVWTLGIWKHVRLESTGPARIDWTRVQTTLADDHSQATVKASLEVDSLAELPVRATFRIGGGAAATKSVAAALKRGRNRIEAELLLEHPALWWPNGQGAQPLYTLERRDRAARRLPQRCPTNALRRPRPALGAYGGAPGKLREPISIDNQRPPRAHDGLGPHLPVHSPRLWAAPRAATAAAGPGRRHEFGPHQRRRRRHLFDGAWYDLADELGIMISHEFPIGNCSPETDPVFLANLETTVRSMLKEYRNHPSIVEFVGGNEMSWNSTSRHPALQLMQTIAAEETDQVFRATCPDAGATHSPWMFDIRGTYRHYNAVETMRYGEFGSCSPAHVEVWHRDIPPASQWPINLQRPGAHPQERGAGCLQPEHVVEQGGGRLGVPSAESAGVRSRRSVSRGRGLALCLRRPAPQGTPHRRHDQPLLQRAVAQRRRQRPRGFRRPHVHELRLRQTGPGAAQPDAQYDSVLYHPAAGSIWNYG